MNLPVRTLFFPWILAFAWIAVSGVGVGDGTSSTSSDSAEWVLHREEFLSLADWETQKLPKIDRASTYEIVREGDDAFLKATSDRSASGLVWKKRFNVHVYPRLRWRWKVMNVYEKGNARKKSGDDYPLRVYVLFEYDPKEVGFFERIQYNSARIASGEYPPLAVVHYMWANRSHDAEVIKNPFTSKCRMIPLRSGKARTGQWITEEVDIPADYRRAFGGKPPKMATIAIMNDSDNTGEKSVAYLDDLQVFRPAPSKRESSKE